MAFMCYVRHFGRSVAVGAVSGTLVYSALHWPHTKSCPPTINSLADPTKPVCIEQSASKWDTNWDRRDPKITHTNKPKATRHLFLVRHGQFKTSATKDLERTLTELGKDQATITGQRLKLLEKPWTKMVKSTMTRAQETAAIIANEIGTIPIQEDNPLIEEGQPIAPEPPGKETGDPWVYLNDGQRIEAGFRQLFHRADASQDKDSYTLVVCHSNVIRYFVCRALQLPRECWDRLQLNHASITCISIYPSGSVVLNAMGDSGHFPPNYITSR